MNNFVDRSVYTELMGKNNNLVDSQYLDLKERTTVRRS